MKPFQRLKQLGQAPKIEFTSETDFVAQCPNCNTTVYPFTDSKCPFCGVKINQLRLEYWG